MERILYDEIKQVRQDSGDEIRLVKKVYSTITGEVEQEVESFIDMQTLAARIATLQEEIIRLQALQSKLSAKSFDVVEDKRTIVDGKGTKQL